MVKSIPTNIALGYGTKYAINILLGLLAPKTLIANVFSAREFLNASRFALFLVLFNLSYKVILCSLRRLFKNEKLSSIIAAGT